MKKALSLLMASALLLGLLAACGGGGSSAAPESTGGTEAPAQGEEQGSETPAPGGETVTIEFWNSAEGAMATSVDALVAEFNSSVGADKGIHVEAIFQGSDVTEKLNTLAQAGDYANFPDVGQIYSAGIPDMLQMDNLLPIDDVYDSGKFESSVEKGDIIENFQRTYTFEGRLIGMPFNASTMLFYYNKDAAREAGLDAETPPSTIAELAEWTEALTIRDGDAVTRYGLNIQVDRYELVNYLAGIGADGVNYIGDNGGGRDGMMTKLTIGEDGSLMKLLNEWEKVVNTGGFKAVNDNEREEFAVGMSAMNYQSSSQLSTMIELTKDSFELGVAFLPRNSEEDAWGASVGGGSLCMFDLGDETRQWAAWEFVQFMVSPESQLFLLKNNGYLPVNDNTYSMPEYEAFIEEQPLAAVPVEQLRISHPHMQEPLDILNWELNALARDGFIDWVDGKVTKEQLHDNIVDGFNAKLEEYLRANA